MFGSALLAKKLALVRLEHTSHPFSALRGLGISDPYARNVETLFCIPPCVTVADAQSRLRDKSQPPPLKGGTQLKNLCHGPERGTISFPWHHAFVLILDLGLIRFELTQNHGDGLQNIQRRKAVNRNWFVFVLGEPPMGSSTHHHR